MKTELPPDLRAPEEPRRFRLHRFQWIGMPLILLVPLLALFGLFGETRDHVEEVGSELAVDVEYATRYRYKQINWVETVVENRADSLLDTVVVDFDPAYVSRFSTYQFIPSPTEAFRVELVGMKPRERRIVWAELQAEQYGRHEGTLDVYRKGGGDTVRVQLSTFIYP